MQSPRCLPLVNPLSPGRPYARYLLTRDLKSGNPSYMLQLPAVTLAKLPNSSELQIHGDKIAPTLYGMVRLRMG